MAVDDIRHPIGHLVLEQLKPIHNDVLGFDEAGGKAVFVALAEALKGEQAQSAFDTMFIVSGFLGNQGQDLAADLVMLIAFELMSAAQAVGVNIEAHSAKLEQAGARFAKLTDQKPMTAPKEGETSRGAMLTALGAIKNFK